MKSLLLLTLIVASVTQLCAARPQPEAQIATFFAILSDKDGAEAIDGLCRGTFLEVEKAAQLAAFSPQLDAAIKLYGKITRFENVDKRLFGESFVKFRVITYHTSGAPLFWEFTFSRAKDDWQVHIFQFNDQFDRVFPSNPCSPNQPSG